MNLCGLEMNRANHAWVSYWWVVGNKGISKKSIPQSRDSRLVPHNTNSNSRNNSSNRISSKHNNDTSINP